VTERVDYGSLNIRRMGRGPVISKGFFRDRAMLDGSRCQRLTLNSYRCEDGNLRLSRGAAKLKDSRRQNCPAFAGAYSVLGVESASLLTVGSRKRQAL